MEKSKPKSSLWEWVKAICTVVLTTVIAIKIYQTPTSLTVDFPTLLSLLLALFAVGLAALFYFKATETSNTFYDNTNKFTRDIASLLVKMESGFGEKLRHLDEGYSSIRGHFQNLPAPSKGELEETKKKLETEREEKEKVLDERNVIIQDLVERSELEKEEKESVLQALRNKEEEAHKAQMEIEQLNRHLTMERVRSRRFNRSKKSLDNGLTHFTSHNVISLIGEENILFASDSSLKEIFNSVAEDLPKGYINDLEIEGYFEEGLTPSGLRFLREVIDSQT